MNCVNDPFNVCNYICYYATEFLLLIQEQSQWMHLACSNTYNPCKDRSNTFSFLQRTVSSNFPKVKLNMHWTCDRTYITIPNQNWALYANVGLAIPGDAAASLHFVYLLGAWFTADLAHQRALKFISILWSSRLFFDQIINLAHTNHWHGQIIFRQQRSVCRSINNDVLKTW